MVIFFPIKRSPEVGKQSCLAVPCCWFPRSLPSCSRRRCDVPRRKHGGESTARRPFRFLMLPQKPYLISWAVGQNWVMGYTTPIHPSLCLQESLGDALHLTRGRSSLTNSSLWGREGMDTEAPSSQIKNVRQSGLLLSRLKISSHFTKRLTEPSGPLWSNCQCSGELS